MLNPSDCQPMQLGLFEHSRDVMLRNDVLQALERRDADAAHSARQKLAEEYPLDSTLPDLQLLIDALGSDAPEPFADHDALHAARLQIEESIEPAARLLFGAPAGQVWLVPLWQRLAQRAARLPFRSDLSKDHAAPIWLRAGNANAASDAVAGIESWRRIAAPLEWMAEARYRIGGIEAAWPLLAELAWLAPMRFHALTARLADPSLVRLRKAFDAEFEGDGSEGDLAWFPAWVLTQATGLARLLRETQPARQTPPEQAMRLLLELLSLERQGRHQQLVERRRVLRGLHRVLYDAYMKTR